MRSSIFRRRMWDMFQAMRTHDLGPKTRCRAQRGTSVVAGDECRELLGAYVCLRELRVSCAPRVSANCECPLRTVYSHSVAPICTTHSCVHIRLPVFSSPIKVHRLDFCSVTNSRSRSLSLSRLSAFLP